MQNKGKKDTIEVENNVLRTCERGKNITLEGGDKQNFPDQNIDPCL
jgi:hypothetical protein